MKKNTTMKMTMTARMVSKKETKQKLERVTDMPGRELVMIMRTTTRKKVMMHLPPKERSEPNI
jgi:hypothetical protein